MTDILIKLQSWYGSQCNGKWEHSYGIQINTLDNPGWEVRIDLTNTRYQNETWSEVKLDNGEHDWIFCKKTNGFYEGRGDPLKLDQILNEFLLNINPDNRNSSTP